MLQARTGQNLSADDIGEEAVFNPVNSGFVLVPS
jgi:hypothetical protein